MKIHATINGRDMTAEQYSTYHATRAAAWVRHNPAQAAEHDDAHEQAKLAIAQLRAEGAPVGERVDVQHWLRAELADIGRRYAVSDYYDDGPYIRGLWEL